MTTSEAASGTGGATTPGRRRVLLVEDEPSARAALTELLLDEGYDVMAAVDGEDALACLAGFRPDVVITDLKMPRLDGNGLIARLAELMPDVPVILMTAFAALGHPSTREHGAVELLGKPIDFDRLVASIERARA